MKKQFLKYISYDEYGFPLVFDTLDEAWENGHSIEKEENLEQFSVVRIDTVAVVKSELYLNENNIKVFKSTKQTPKKGK